MDKDEINQQLNVGVEVTTRSQAGKARVSQQEKVAPTAPVAMSSLVKKVKTCVLDDKDPGPSGCQPSAAGDKIEPASAGNLTGLESGKPTISGSGRTIGMFKGSSPLGEEEDQLTMFPSFSSLPSIATKEILKKVVAEIVGDDNDSDFDTQDLFRRAKDDNNELFKRPILNCRLVAINGMTL